MDFDQYEAVFNMPKIRLLLFFYFYDQQVPDIMLKYDSC